MPVESGNDIDKLLLLADRTLVNQRRSAIGISIAIMRILNHGRYSLRYLETRYRALDSATFLIAVPSDYAPSMTMAMTRNNEPANYFLWVSVNGRDEADSEFDKLGVTYEENFERLDKTGFLVMRDSV